MNPRYSILGSGHLIQRIRIILETTPQVSFEPNIDVKNFTARTKRHRLVDDGFFFLLLKGAPNLLPGKGQGDTTEKAAILGTKAAAKELFLAPSPCCAVRRLCCGTVFWSSSLRRDDCCGVAVAVGLYSKYALAWQRGKKLEQAIILVIVIGSTRFVGLPT